MGISKQFSSRWRFCVYFIGLSIGMLSAALLAEKSAGLMESRITAQLDALQTQGKISGDEYLITECVSIVKLFGPPMPAVE
jgi:hypothetical protein